MALCAPMNMALDTSSLPHYPRQSLRRLQTMYETSWKKASDADLNDRLQLAESLVRSLSVEGVLPLSRDGKQYNRTISLFVSQSRYEPADEFCSISISNDCEFFSIPEEEDVRYYSTKHPYRYPSKEHRISSPPTGYEPINVQLLARHGSRSLNGHNFDLQLLQIWELAKENDMLTTLGEQLEVDTKLFMDANNLVGRGELTQVGREEHFALGTRLYHRLKSVFHPSNQVSVMTSGKKRAVDSSEEFVNALTNADPTLQIAKVDSNKKLLYFHKSCPKYMAFKKNDLQVKSKLESIRNLEQTREYSQQVLRRIYLSEFVDLLINGDYSIPSEEKPRDEVDIVLSLYAMFVVAPAQSTPQLKKMLAKYFTEEESNWFAYLHDAKEFYVKGPSIEGTTVTYDMAKPLLADFFSSINDSIEGRTNVAAHLRFAHAETVIPFATLLQIPGFSSQATHCSDLYTYENNPWRGDQIAPMAANIQWEIYQHERHSNQILVRMLYNETEVRFREDCQPFTTDSFFYDFNELQRVYADVLAPVSAGVNSTL